MTRTWLFGLPYTSAPFGLSLNDRAHWGVKAKAAARVRLAVFGAVVNLGVPTLEKCRVDVEWVVRTKTRRDTDNLAPLLKVIYDAIGADTGVSAHIVPDDAPQYMDKTSATIRYEKDAVQHFEVTITEVTA